MDYDDVTYCLGKVKTIHWTLYGMSHVSSRFPQLITPEDIDLLLGMVDQVMMQLEDFQSFLNPTSTAD